MAREKKSALAKGEIVFINLYPIFNKMVFLDSLEIFSYGANKTVFRVLL